MGTRSRRLSPQASTRRPTTLRAIVPTTRMMATAVRNPSPGRGRPSIFSYMGAKTSSIRLQKIQRSHAVRKTGTVTKKPAIKRTLSQFLMVSSRIAPRASGAGRVRRRALVTGGAIRVGQAIALSLARAGMDVAIGYHRSEEHTSELQSHSDLVCRLLLEKKKKNNKTKERAHGSRTKGTRTIV